MLPPRGGRNILCAIHEGAYDRVFMLEYYSRYLSQTPLETIVLPNKSLKYCNTATKQN